MIIKDTSSTKEMGLKVDNYNAPHVIATALSESTSIVHSENQQSRVSRFEFDSNIRWRYERRPVEAEDSLRTIRAYNYMNPDSVVMMNIPPMFGIDTEITEKTIKHLLEKGVVMSTINQIMEMKQSIIDYYKAGLSYELYQLIGKEVEEGDPDMTIEDLSPEMRNTPEVLELQEKYLDFPPFPYILMGKDIEHSPRLRVTLDDVNSNSTYYALCTTVPQHVDDLMCKTYIGQCVHYMIGTMGEQCQINEIGLNTDVYYDYLITENATLYIFLHLLKH